ncbi:MAG: PhzF family phenazine biosynthesis protein [Pseudomonadota bacterium]
MKPGSIDNPLRRAAFCRGSLGGNPAGVVLVDTFPALERMQATAKDLGYSETAFVVPTSTGHAVRYFSPLTEVPFCGHATIAAVTVLGEHYAAGKYLLSTAAGDVAARASRCADNGRWQGAFEARPATESAPSDSLIDAVCAAFGLRDNELDPALPPTCVAAGAQHLQLGVADRDVLAAMSYAFDTVATLMRAHQLVTINLLWRENETTFHSRNAFASGGVYEDPATGAAAAALGGYLRTRGLRGAVQIDQGDDMGVPCRIGVVINEAPPPLEVTGLVRPLPE